MNIRNNISRLKASILEGQQDIQSPKQEKGDAVSKENMTPHVDGVLDFFASSMKEIVELGVDVQDASDLTKSFVTKFSRLSRNGLTDGELKSFTKSLSDFEEGMMKLLGGDLGETKSLTKDEARHIERDVMAAYGEVVVESPNRRYEANERSAIRNYFADTKDMDLPKVKTPTNSAYTSLHKLSPEGRKQLGKFQDYILSNWGKFDSDKNGTLEFFEVRGALADKSIDGKAMDYVYSLTSSFSTLASIYDNAGVDNISRKEIRSLTEPGSFDKASFENRNSFAKRFAGQFGKDEAVIAGKDYSHLDKPFVGKPDPLSIAQGSIGDCWMIATFSDMTENEIKDIVRPVEGKDQVAVHLPSHEPIMVDSPSQMERHYSVDSNGYWGYALEEALRQVRPREDQVTGDPINGGWQTEAAQYLYGEGGDGITTVFGEADASYFKDYHFNDYAAVRKPKEVMDFLVKHQSEGDKLFAASELDGGDENTLENGVVSTHAYTIMGFDEKEGTVTVRNPWRKDSLDKEGENDGIYTLSVEEFTASFCMVMSVAEKGTSA